MNTIGSRWHLCCVGSIALCSLIASTGCRRSDTVSVNGQLALDGVALPSGNLVLIPMNANAGPSVGCAIVEGRYSIPADRGPRRGVKYRVEIRSIDPDSGSTADPRSGGESPVFRDRVPAAYNSESQLDLVIPEDSTGLQKDFDLNSRAGK